VKRFLVACLFACATVGAGATAIPATGTVEVLFTPWDDAEGAIVRALGEARQGIHVQAFLLTSRSIARALREAHDRGVRVEVLADREMLRKGENSQLPMLAAAGIPVWLETRYASAHNKVLLIDGESPAAVRHHRQLQFHLVGTGTQCREPAAVARQPVAGAALPGELATPSRRRREV
jgi:phosphatidylserine/phosphatidylglycerophosphate/cardiolipin synthase-like enzyme